MRKSHEVSCRYGTFSNGNRLFHAETKVGQHKFTYLDRCGETARVLGRCHYQGIDVRLPEILEIQFFCKFHDSGGRADVERSRGPLTLRLQRVPYLPIGERLGFHRYYAETSPTRDTCARRI